MKKVTVSISAVAFMFATSAFASESGASKSHFMAKHDNVQTMILYSHYSGMNNGVPQLLAKMAKRSYQAGLIDDAHMQIDNARDIAEHNMGSGVQFPNTAATELLGSKLAGDI
ncbi:MAG: hypothetical protein ABW126_03345 [Candidatus Sedimenticola sp. 4PFRAG1]